MQNVGMILPISFCSVQIYVACVLWWPVCPLGYVYWFPVKLSSLRSKVLTVTQTYKRTRLMKRWVLTKLTTVSCMWELSVACIIRSYNILVFCYYIIWNFSQIHICFALLKKYCIYRIRSTKPNPIQSSRRHMRRSRRGSSPLLCTWANSS